MEIYIVMKFLITSILLSISIIAIGQKDYVDGYIITLEEEKLQGKVSFHGKRSDLKVCKFKRNGQVYQYGPSTIKGFGYDGRYFSRGYLNLHFVEVLIEGELSLFRFKDEYLLIKQNSGNFEEISTSKNTDQDELSQAWIDKSTWKGILTSYVSDCDTYDPNYFKRKEFNSSIIPKEVLRYNRCKDNLWKLYTNKRPFLKIGLGIQYNFQYSYVGVKTANTIAANFPSSFVGYAGGYGGLLEIKFPRRYPKTSLRYGFSVSKIDYVSQYTSSTGGLDVSLSYESFYVPIDLKYNLFVSKSAPYIYSGINYINEKRPNSPASAYLGLTAGCGYEYSHKYFTVQFDIRYYAPDLTQTPFGGVVYNNNIFMFGFNIIKHFTFQKK